MPTSRRFELTYSTPSTQPSWCHLGQQACTGSAGSRAGHCSEISCLHRYLTFSYINVQTRLFARARRAPTTPKKAARSGRGGTQQVRGAAVPPHPHAGAQCRGKAACVRRTGCRPTSSCPAGSPNRSCLLQRVGRGTAENPAGLWKLPAAVPGEREAVSKQATKFISQCPGLQRKKVQLLCLVLELPLTHL